jgi:hypothetical protein
MESERNESPFADPSIMMIIKFNELKEEFIEDIQEQLKEYKRTQIKKPQENTEPAK